MKKIRLKFFIIAAFSLFIVLFSIIAGFNISNYINLKNDAASTCDYILNTLNESPVNANDPDPKDPEVIFRSRFFISTYINHELVSIDTSRVARINIDEAITMSNEVYSNNSTNDFYNVYFYERTSNEVVEKIIFLDQQVELDSYNLTLRNSSIIAACGYIIVLVLIYLLSSFVIKPVEEANSKQKRFITDASHELKTPLTIINSNLSLLEMEKGQSEWIDSTKKQVERLKNMTNELVMLSKLNEDNLKLNKIDIEMEPLLLEAAKPYLNLLKEKEIELIFDLDSSICYKGDILLLSQLFNTLLDNMSKYAYKGEAKIISRKIRSNINISFENQIAPNSNIDTNLIFDRFYKADISRNSKMNSFGVGLSMAKSIVELHKGKINASIVDNKIIFKIIL